MSSSTDTIAALLVDAHTRGIQFQATPAPAPATAKDAYAAQDRVFAALYPGQRGGAWKVGGASPDVEPTAAPIPSAGLHPSPAHVPAKGFHMIGIESEIAFRLGRDLPPRAAPYTEDEIAAGVTEALVTIELCDTRLSNWKDTSALWRLADFQLNAALVIGSGRQDWRAIDFTKQRAELWIDGALNKEATGVHPYGNPIRLLPWLAAHCAARGGGLHAGDIITTGTWTGMEFVAPGAEVRACFPGIGEASVTLVK
ncbi:MAG: fumarylacetoacetate hydrolase family protein [Proteobacteria bacterium]|nr:fumarylacetoacetate hydrolase family protein [Pseudomonadota bacterium]